MNALDFRTITRAADAIFDRVFSRPNRRTAEQATKLVELNRLLAPAGAANISNFRISGYGSGTKFSSWTHGPAKKEQYFFVAQESGGVFVLDDKSGWIKLKSAGEGTGACPSSAVETNVVTHASKIHALLHKPIPPKAAAHPAL